jgi:hypothetical protein
MATGTGGATGTGAATGTGGTGGGTTTGTGGGCTMASDCPGPAMPNPCASPACDPTTHTCTLDVLMDGGLAPSGQVKGSCKDVICDSMGKAVSVNDDNNVAVSTEVCIVDGCNMGAPTHTDVAGPCTENGGKVCGTPGGPKTGTCVACNVAADCGGNDICQLNHCVTSSCNDGVQDGSETDVDCGGTCAPCGDDYKCLVDADCQSMICGPTKTCTPASCSDGTKNEGETDVDCGGPVCRPQGKLCGTNMGCAIGADCQSLDCDPTSHLCLKPTCFDGIQNQGETDKDCGGPNCSPCAVGMNCVLHTDCTDMHCIGAVCCHTACTDNGATSCGTNGQCLADGSACALYAAGTSCSQPSCSGNMLTQGGTCNGTGTCTAGSAAACPGNLLCSGPTACASSCTPGTTTSCTTNYTCDSSGTTCLRSNGQGCAQDGDCANKHCVGGGSKVCCQTTCATQMPATCGTTGQCLANGMSCAYYGTSQACGQACVGHTLTMVGNCDGMGTCNPGPMSPCPNNFACQTPLVCATSCMPGMTNGCAPGFVCNKMGNGCGLPDGTACTMSSDCASSQCVGNICCATGCTDMGATSCGTNGQCLPDGSACALYPLNTMCKAPSCSGSTLTGAGACDGMGACVSGGASACANNLRCADMMSCASSCTPGTTSSCTSNHTCAMSGMGCLLSNGQTCTMPSDCANGWCYGTPMLKCQPNSCNDGVQDDTETDIDCGGAICDAVGNTCVYNQVCAANADCTSGVCNGAGGPDAGVFLCGCTKNGDCPPGNGCNTTTNLCGFPSGSPCTLNSDCESGVCMLPDGGADGGAMVCQ